MNKKISIFMFLSFYSIFGYILLLLSLTYLLSNKIYIVEQGIYSHLNESLIYFIPFFLIFIFLLFIFSITTKISMVKSHKYFLSRVNHKIILILLTLLLSLSYINIFISENLPIFSDGYISRFDFLHDTKLWGVLAPFGQVIVIIPITLGYLLMQSSLQGFKTRYIFIYFLIYLFYLILIGQKFGAFLLGGYYLMLPTIVHRLLHNEKIISLKLLSVFFLASLLIFLLIVYHYGHLPIAEEFGGPINFIFYRLFGLQGHTFWGIVEQLNNLPISISNWWEGMHNMMRIIGIDGIERAIERGVNFTGGYPVVLLITFPFIGSIFVYTILSSIFFIFLRFLVLNIYNPKYIFYAYILLYINSFQSLGSLSLLLNYKVLLLSLIIIVLTIIPVQQKRLKI